MRCEYDSRVIYDTDEKKWAANRLNVYRAHDKKAERPFSLTISDFLGLRERSCYYCDRRATGLDRVINELGHVPSNVVPSCWRCNRVRCDMLSHEVMLKVGALLKEIDP